MKRYLIVLGLIINFSLLSASWATSMRPISLEQLSTRATLIFYGEVINNQTEINAHNSPMATFTTFKVIDLIKGKTGETHTIKQIGGSLDETNIVHRVHGIPEFQPGKQYVVFLPKISKLGFSSPLGLHQGSFNVTTIDGEKVITNGRNLNTQQKQINRNVTLPLAVNPDKPSQARLDDFTNTIRAYNAP